MKNQAKPTKQIWDHYAQENAEFYISTNGNSASLERFFESGEEDCQRILKLCDALLPGRTLALEIGCGVGQLTLPLSRAFANVMVVDVSPTMLRKLSDNCARFGVTNVVPHLSSEPWVADAVCDLAVSIYVFQHIPSEAVIADYAAGIARSLKPDGVAVLHFDTRPASIGYRLRNVLPDFILPRTQREGIRRNRRSHAVLVELFASLGMELIANEGRDSAEDYLVLRKAASH